MTDNMSLNNHHDRERDKRAEIEINNSGRKDKRYENSINQHLQNDGDDRDLDDEKEDRNRDGKESSADYSKYIRAR